jgi:hypothetical protein
LTAFAALAMTATFLVPATAANATDIGDGSVNCNSGEICFKRDNGGSNIYLRHYWYSDMTLPAHGGPNFSDGGGIVEDNISSEYNRDTECNVYLEDIDGAGYWFGYYIMERRQSGGYYYVGDSKNDRNNGHNRCYEVTNHS